MMYLTAVSCLPHQKLLIQFYPVRPHTPCSLRLCAACQSSNTCGHSLTHRVKRAAGRRRRASAWWVALKCVRDLHFLSVLHEFSLNGWNLCGNGYFPPPPFFVLFYWCHYWTLPQIVERTVSLRKRWVLCDSSSSGSTESCHNVALQLLSLIMSHRGNLPSGHCRCLVHTKLLWSPAAFALH